MVPPESVDPEESPIEDVPVALDILLFVEVEGATLRT
jgi:hypothetical protein